VNKLLTLSRPSRELTAILIFALSAAIPVAGIAQTSDAFDWKDKLRFHAESTYSPSAILGVALYAGILQEADAPKEWKQGAGPYGKRFASTLAWSGVHSAMAFGLDSTLHQDPRYYRSGDKGFWRRSGHALRGTMLTRTDSGKETLSTWRLGSAYGAAFLSNMWYPDRLNTVSLGLIEGSVTLGLEFFSNLGKEFWPDIKKKAFRRN
jgi:hypothetical protein